MEGIRILSQLVDKELIRPNEMLPWAECNFSTSTPTDRLVSKIMLLGSMKEYFTYRMTTFCGIPSIMLKGTLQDWKEIRMRIEKLGNFQTADAAGSHQQLHSLLQEKLRILERWRDILRWILDEFVEAFSTGIVHPEFWTRIVSKYSTKGSGSSTYITGWITAFVPFQPKTGMFLLDRMKPMHTLRSTLDIVAENTQIDMYEVASSAVEVPFIQSDPMDRNRRNMLFYAGLIATTDEQRKSAVTPSVEWSLFQLDGPPLALSSSSTTVLGIERSQEAQSF
jgi:hypothetical protein